MQQDNKILLNCSPHQERLSILYRHFFIAKERGYCMFTKNVRYAEFPN